MDAKEDECSFDELSALLDDSDDEAVMQEAATLSAQEVADNNGQSSDDDIDDDELDRLAMLVESGEVETADDAALPPPYAHTPQTVDEQKVDLPKENSTVSQAVTVKSEPKTPEDKSNPKVESMSPTVGKVEEDESEDEEVSAMKEEMKRMKQRIKELELKKLRARLKELEEEEDSETGVPSIKVEKSPSIKTKTTLERSPSSKTKVPNTASPKGNIKSDRSNSVKTGCSKTTPTRSTSDIPSRKQRPNPCLDKKKVPGIVKDLELDLFGSETSSSSPKPTFTKQTSKVPEQKSSPSVKPLPPNTCPSSQSIKRPSQTTRPTLSLAGLTKDERKVHNARATGIDDDEVDWDMEGEGSSSLSTEGKEYERLLKVGTNRGQRTAHTPNSDISQLNNRKATWGGNRPPLSQANKGSPWRDASSSKLTQMIQKEEEDANVHRDPFSGIRIVDPLVSSTQMKLRMENRCLIKLSTIYQKAKSSLEGDWVTIGVLVYKSDPKTSQKGNVFSIWTLTDLHDCDHPVKMMLFGEVHKAHWKTSIGAVVGILNPSLMQNNEKYQKSSNEVTITADHAQKVMLMGKSKDMGFCKSKTKAGKNCIQFLNKQKGEYCTYHVQSAYKKASAKRGELQASHTGGGQPKSFEKRLGIGGKNGQVIYGGRGFGGGVATKPDKKASLSSLVQHGSQKAKGKVTTLSLHPLLPEDEKRLKEAESARAAKAEAEKNDLFHGMLTTPTVGAVNLVKHLTKKEVDTPDKSGQEKTKKLIQSIKPKDLLIQHERDMKNKRLALQQKKRLENQRGSSGPMIDLDEPIPAPSRPGSALDCVPQLGRGFTLGGPLKTHNINAALDKQKAARLIHARGGLKKEDPNAVKRKMSPETRENIKKRLAESLDKEDKEGTESSSSGSDEPPKKKSKLLGGVDLEDPEVQKLLKSKSKHAHKLTMMEEEKQAAYFDVLERKEAMEEKMSSITKMKVTAVTCRNCRYSAFSAKPECKEQKHTIVPFETFKRFFSCKDCKRRTVSIDRLPKHCCQGCGSNSWDKAPMMKEKLAQVPGEELLLRGEERKFVNS